MSTDVERSQELKERSFGELAKELSSEVSTLVRKELELFRAEMREKGRQAVPGLELFGVAGVVGLAAAGAATAFLILVLDTFMPAWLAALTVTVVLGAIAVVLGMQGKRRVEEAGTPVPEQTIESVKEDVEWAKTQAKSGRR